MSLSHKTLLATVTTVLISGCATPTVVQSVKPGDNGLSCAQLQNEYADAERYRVEADKEKSVTGGNVARALLFWPAILGTASNANEAIAAANNRKVHLMNQMNQKNCDSSTTSAAISNVSVQPSKTTTTNVQSPQTKEAKLTELKQIFDAGLISPKIYSERQAQILSE